MVKQKPIDREKQKQVQEIEAQLRASANSASKIVGSWLPSDDDEDEAEADKKKLANTAALKPRDVFKGRPARLGVGAKFLSHKEMMSNSQSGPGILTAEELQLKRKLTKGAPTDSKKSSMAEKRKSVDDDDDDVDSRSRMAVKASVVSGSSSHNASPTAANMATKKKSKTSSFLDSLITRRKK
ncbi:hypothetical protein GGI10_002968 [Coemansia sp. RSA 2530]|nr:hypothetical protein GGI10_002968 [Coemansia sp. RSA 2530]